MRFARSRSKTSRPFLLLVRLFAARVFQGGASEDGDLQLGIGLVLTVLALPGAFYSLFLLEKYSTLLQWMQIGHVTDPLLVVLPDEYFFIVLSMSVTGIVAVWRWDSIFPDRRDYANLVPLPISVRSILFANLSAILLLALLLAVDVNAASAVLFPLVVSASENSFSFLVQFAAIHAVTVVCASIFSFCAVFAVVGVLMLVLPYRAFRRASFYARALIVTGFLGLFATSFVTTQSLTRLRWPPSIWFLGLFNLLRGNAGGPLARSGHVALLATGTVMIAAIAIYALAYRRCFVRIPEMSDIAPGTRYVGSWAVFRILDRLVVKSPFQRAGYRFAIKTLLRSEHHGLVLGAFSGLAVVIGSQLLIISVKQGGAHRHATPLLLAIPLVFSYCLLLGVRFAFEIPAEMNANWMFRFYVGGSSDECAPLARKVMLTFVVPWVVAVLLPLCLYAWGWRIGLVHSAVIVLCSMLLAEILLRNYRRIPFTSPYPMFGQSAVMMALVYVLGFLVFVFGISNLEYWAVSNWIASLALPIILLAILIALLNNTGEEGVEQPVKFEEDSAAFELLNLKQE